MAAAMKKTLLALAVALLPSQLAATTAIENINGIQVGPDGKLQRFCTLVIGDDGKVADVIGCDVLAQVAATNYVDGGGRTVLPGIVDAHGHVIESSGGDTGLGLMLLQLDLNGTASLEDLQQRLRSYAAANAGGGWILGRGWNQELWTDKRFPTAADLDAVVSDRPVFLTRVDGHAAVANTAALKLAGITAARDPQGGKIERDANGAPTGLFIDNAMDLLVKAIPRPTAAELDRAFAKAQDLLLSYGITAVGAMSTPLDSWNAMKRAGENGRLSVRLTVYADQLAPVQKIAKPTPWLYGDRLRLVGVKFYADGALGSRGAWLKEAYADKPDTKGLQFHPDAELLALANTAASRGFQVAIHAIGDAADAQVISVFERLSRKYGADRRWRIEHFQVADPADIPRLAKSGIIASMQPVHQTSDRLMAEARLGPNRLAGAYAWQSVLKSGARLAFGTDFPVESPNPFPGLAAANSRQDMNGQPTGGWLPEERLSFEQALAAYTRGAAYAGFAEDRIGALERGKWADFIFVDRDPTKIGAQELARTEVLETWVAGKKVWERAATIPAQTERGK